MRSSGSSHPTEVNEGRASAFDFQHRRNIGKLRHRGWGRTPERGSLGVLCRTPQGMQRRTKPKSLSPMSTTATSAMFALSSSHLQHTSRLPQRLPQRRARTLECRSACPSSQQARKPRRRELLAATPSDGVGGNYQNKPIAADSPVIIATNPGMDIPARRWTPLVASRI